MSTITPLSDMTLLELCAARRAIAEAMDHLYGENEVWDRLCTLCSRLDAAIFTKEAATAQEVAEKVLVIRDFDGDGLGASLHHPAFWADMARVAGRPPIAALLPEWRQLREANNTLHGF